MLRWKSKIQDDNFFFFLTLGTRFILLFVRMIFTPALANGFPLESEWQHVSSIFHDSFQYFDWSQQSCSLDGLLLTQSPTALLLVTVLSASVTIVSPSLSCSIAFSVLLQGLGTYLSFRILSVLRCDLLKRQSPLFSRFFFCVDNHKVWSSGRD